MPEQVTTSGRMRKNGHGELATRAIYNIRNPEHRKVIRSLLIKTLSAFSSRIPMLIGSQDQPAVKIEERFKHLIRCFHVGVMPGIPDAHDIRVRNDFCETVGGVPA